MTDLEHKTEVESLIKEALEQFIGSPSDDQTLSQMKSVATQVSRQYLEQTGFNYLLSVVVTGNRVSVLERRAD